MQLTQTRSMPARHGVVMARHLNLEEPAPMPKEDPVRSDAYLGLVRRLACRGCGKSRPLVQVQAAHMNLGKGAGIKADDRFTFPLCPVCHAILDQPGPSLAMDKASRRQQEAIWTIHTLKVIVMTDHWPEGLQPLSSAQWEWLIAWAGPVHDG